jgi:hypothetical protein
MSKHERLAEALNLWVSITGFDDKRQSFNTGNWEIKQMSEVIREALELDTTNITGFLMLGYFTDQFMQNTSFTIPELIHEAPRVEDFLARSQRLLAILKDKEMLEELAHFQLVTRQAVRHYKADTEEVMALIENSYDMAFLRRDALKSMQNLRVDHFLEGEVMDESVQPAYHREVYQFWNINSLLRAVCSSPSGVSLNLVRTPDNYQSYFVFAIRNGGHVITLSDVPKHAHPLAQYFSRRPEKDFSRRMNQNWFPYHLMDIKYDEDMTNLWFAQQESNGLVPLNQQAFPLSALSELKGPEVIWITLMFELIVERFWRQPVAPKQLSYTGEMIRVENALIETATAAGLPVVQYQGLSMKELTVDEVINVSEEHQAALGAKGGNHNDWMVNRYRHKVNQETMNLMATGAVTSFISSGNEDGPTSISHEDNRRHNQSIMDRTQRYEIHHLDTASFGTQEQLVADRLFISRHNLAQEVERHAQNEFDATKDEIIAWYTSRLEQNIERLYDLASQDRAWRLFTGDRTNKAFTSSTSRNDGPLRYELARLFEHETIKRQHLHFNADVRLSQGWNHTKSKPYCHMNGATSNYTLHINPQCKEDLAFLTNTPVDQLPEVLQHWHVETRSHGNHNLQRIDPLSWALHNPWEKNDMFSIVLSLSTSAVNSIRKQRQLPEGFFPDSGYVSPRFFPGLELDPQED